MKVDDMVTTKDRGNGIIQRIDGDYAIVWFGGHQRNSYWYELDELKAK